MPTKTVRNRQRVWQSQRVARGLCATCGKDPLYKDQRCFAHYIKRHISPRVSGLSNDLTTARELGHYLAREIRWAVRRDRRNRV